MSDGIVIAVITGLAALSTATLTGLLALRSHRDTNLRDDMKSLRTEVGELRREVRALTDYALQLRNDVESAGADVRPWPDELKR